MTYKTPEPLTEAEFNILTANARLMAFGVVRRMAVYRRLRGLSQKGLGKLVGVTQSTVSEWETGVVMPQLDSIMRVCQVLEIPFQFGEP